MARDATTRPSVTIKRIQIGSAETLVWVIAAIALPCTPFLDPVRETLADLLVPIGRDPMVAGLAFLVGPGLLTWSAKASPSGTSVRAWVAGAWVAGMLVMVILVVTGLRLMPFDLTTVLPGPWIVLASWVLAGVVASLLIMLGVALATSRFVVRLPADAEPTGRRACHGNVRPDLVDRACTGVTRGQHAAGASRRIRGG